MLFKKGMFVLLSCVGALYSAQSEFFHVKEPSMWRQRFDKRDFGVERIFIVLEWPDQILESHIQLLGEENIFALIKIKRKSEQLLVVSFWEQPPAKYACDPEYKLLKTAALGAYYCSQKSRLIVFPSQSAYAGSLEGVSAVKGDHKDYDEVAALIEQAMRPLSSRKREIFCIGTVPLLESVKKYFTHLSITYFFLEPLEGGKPSPVREFIQSPLDLLHCPLERPIPVKNVSPLEGERGRNLFFELEKPIGLIALRRRLEKLRTLD
jgi:hypothetical protein